MMKQEIFACVIYAQTFNRLSSVKVTYCIDFKYIKVFSTLSFYIFKKKIVVKKISYIFAEIYSKYKRHAVVFFIVRKRFWAYFMYPTCLITQLNYWCLYWTFPSVMIIIWAVFTQRIEANRSHKTFIFSSPSLHFFAFCFSSWPSFSARDLAEKQSTPAVSVVPFRSNTVSPLKSPSSVRVKSGQVHIFQLRYLKRCGPSAK